MFKYLKHIELPYFDGEIHWGICPYSGNLLKSQHQNKQKKIPNKVKDAVNYCNEPYKLVPNINQTSKSLGNNKIVRIEEFHNKILKIGNSKFYKTRIYSSFKKLMFDSTDEALLNINSLSIQKELKHQLCLQRVFLAAKISKSFMDNGVLFIGAFLPTGDMHAWIIENGTQPDFEDRGWINYRPLLAFYH